MAHEHRKSQDCFGIDKRRGSGVTHRARGRYTLLSSHNLHYGSAPIIKRSKSFQRFDLCLACRLWALTKDGKCGICRGKTK